MKLTEIGGQTESEQQLGGVLMSSRAVSAGGEGTDPDYAFHEDS